MKHARTPLACLSLVGSGLVVFLGLSYAPYVRAQGSQSSIKQLFAFPCDSSTNACPQGKDASSVIQSADGNFYGTAEFGGSGTQAAGTVFKLTPTGGLTTIYTFVGSANGAKSDQPG